MTFGLVFFLALAPTVCLAAICGGGGAGTCHEEEDSDGFAALQHGRGAEKLNIKPMLWCPHGPNPPERRQCTSGRHMFCNWHCSGGSNDKYITCEGRVEKAADCNAHGCNYRCSGSSTQVRKPTCATPGQDVYDDHTFRGHTPVQCCDGQAATNQDGKMVCPANGQHSRGAEKLNIEPMLWCPHGPNPPERRQCTSGRHMFCNWHCSGGSNDKYITCEGRVEKAADCNAHGCNYRCSGSSTQVRKPTCATPGQDVYDDYTFRGHTPVQCCDGQAATNQNGKMVCPANVCAHPGQDVYDDYTFKGHTPVKCCDGQAATNRDGKMVCPLKVCGHPGQDVYDDYTFKGHTPVQCCDGQAPANQNGKLICQGGKTGCAKPGWDDRWMHDAPKKKCCDGKVARTHREWLFCP